MNIKGKMLQESDSLLKDLIWKTKREINELTKQAKDLEETLVALRFLRESIALDLLEYNSQEAIEGLKTLTPIIGTNNDLY